MWYFDYIGDGGREKDSGNRKTRSVQQMEIKQARGKVTPSNEQQG